MQTIPPKFRTATVIAALFLSVSLPHGAAQAEKTWLESMEEMKLVRPQKCEGKIRIVLEERQWVEPDGSTHRSQVIYCSDRMLTEAEKRAKLEEAKRTLK